MSTENKLRFPQPDGSVKVVDTQTGDVTFEGVADDAPKDAPRTAPFATPSQTADANVVELRKQPEEPTLGETLAKRREPDTTEQLAAESVRKDEPVAYPAGAPELRSLLRLPFKRRASAMRLYQAALDAWNHMPSQGTNLDSPDKLERYFGALQAFDEFLETVAANPQAYRSWVDNAGDAQFGDLVFAYITRFGLGES